MRMGRRSLMTPRAAQRRPFFGRWLCAAALLSVRQLGGVAPRRVLVIAIVLAFATGCSSVRVFLSCPPDCVELVRVPLAVPLNGLGGSRPPGPQAIVVGLEYAAGLRGQEQERAGMAGASLGLTVSDRIDLSVSGHSSTAVRDARGDPHTGDATVELRAKVRLGDFREGRTSVGLHVATLSAESIDDRLTALDVAIPVELYPLGGTLPDHRLGVYVAPRFAFQNFEDLHAQEATQGTVRAAVVGIIRRWRHLSLSGELNFANTPEMTLGDTTFPGGTHVLPVLGVRGMIPFGN